MDFLTRFDGSSRKPRPIQIEVLKWLQDNWDKSNAFAINAGTGVGKSAIGRAIQLETGGQYIAPYNTLVDQISESYPGINCVKGQDYYQCNQVPSLTCAERRHGEGSGCKDCRWKQAKITAMSEPSVFNPLSFWASVNNPESPTHINPKVLIIDEAHTLVDMLMLLIGDHFDAEVYGKPLHYDDVSIQEWLKATIAKADKYLRMQTNSELDNPGRNTKAMMRARNKASRMLEVFSKIPHLFFSYGDVRETLRGVQKPTTWIKPIDVPRSLLDLIIGDRKVILMSATLMQSDIKSILGSRDYMFYDAGTPIPVENRLIRYMPPRKEFTYKSDPADVANWIKIVMAMYKGNTIVHVTYSMGKALAPYFPDAFINTSSNKGVVMEKFKEVGGMWLASGCEEGIDLPGECCTVNIIPLMRKPNIGDIYVKKKLALPGGNKWYSHKVLKTFIQSVGRSTRGENDKSIAICGDAAFPRYVVEFKKDIPPSFLAAIKWR